MQPSVDPFHAVANAESVARTRRERRPLEILFGGRQGESPSPPAFAPSRPPVRLIYRLCRARSERSSVVSLCLSSALHTISKADRAGQNPFASVSVCEEGEGWRAAAAAAWQPWYSLKGLVPRGNATDRGPRASWLLFTPRQQARVWQGESLEIGQDDRGASPSPPALPLLPAFAFA